MNVSIETKLIDDILTINIVDLLSSLSGEQEQQLIERLSCSDTIIKHVADQIIHGLTDGGFSGFISGGAGVSTALDAAIRMVAMGSSELAQKEISALERNLLSAEKSRDEFTGKYYDLINGYTI